MTVLEQLGAGMVLFVGAYILFVIMCLIAAVNSGTVEDVCAMAAKMSDAVLHALVICCLYVVVWLKAAAPEESLDLLSAKIEVVVVFACMIIVMRALTRITEVMILSTMHDDAFVRTGGIISCSGLVYTVLLLKWAVDALNSGKAKSFGIEMEEYGLNMLIFPLPYMVYMAIWTGRLCMTGNTYSLRGQRLTEFPKQVLKCGELIGLDLSENLLTSIPEEIEGMKELRILLLSKNKLSSLPEALGNLPELELLDLSENLLESVPRSTENLFNTIGLIDLTDNPLVEHSDDGFGWRQLFEIFGDRVLFSQEIMDQVIPNEISLQEAYEEICSHPVHWNVQTVRDIRPDPVPQHIFSLDQMLILWDSFKHHVSDSEAVQMERYLRCIYGPDWLCRAQNIPAEQLRNLVEAIFLKMVESLSADDIIAYLSEIINAIRFCTDRQIATLDMVYSIVYSKRYVEGLFESVVRGEIAAIKELMFKMAVTRGLSMQNVHVLNTWKHRLKDEVGFNVEYESKMGMLNQDIYRGYPGNVVRAFYSLFTPEYVVERLTHMVNQSQKMLNESGEFLMRQGEDVRQLFDFEDARAEELLIVRRIRMEGVEEILIKMDVLERTDIEVRIHGD